MATSDAGYADDHTIASERFANTGGVVLGSRLLGATIVVTSLGYFIDMFDMFLFNMLRVRSLTDMGLSGAALTDAGFFVANCQWAGFILGAYASGMYSDRAGRKSSLFIAVLVYSLGTLGSAIVTDVHTYGLARFVTGLGLAGELGAGITLIMEKMTPERRGYGIMIFIGMGFLGVLTAAGLSEFVSWRHAYLIGGFGGLLLLMARALLSESGMFEQMVGKKVVRGGLGLILRIPKLRKKYICSICIVLPSVFIPQILWTLSPELGKAMNVMEPVKANVTIGIGYCCVVLGDLFACALSERLKSRKKAVLVFNAIGAVMFLKYLLLPAHTLTEFYLINGVLGLAFGAWVVGAAWGAEHFATNIRATAATTFPNFARATTILMNFAYANLKPIGALETVTIIGAAIFTLAFLGWRGLSETYGKDLDYLEIA